MYWTNSEVSESVKEREVEMSGLVVRFARQMSKRAANTLEETTPGLKVMSGKRSRLSGLDEEVQADPAVLLIDLPERILEASSIIGCAAQDASRKVCAVLEDGAPVGELPCVDEGYVEA